MQTLLYGQAADISKFGENPVVGKFERLFRSRKPKPNATGQYAKAFAALKTINPATGFSGPE
jgi:hypothetical protein